jgi:hypothetical protein
MGDLALPSVVLFFDEDLEVMVVVVEVKLR